MQTYEEIWKDIKGYEGIYQVSTYGRIKNSSGKVLKQTIAKGYYYISLNKNHKASTKSVHRIVALTFLPNGYSKKKEVNHIDENKLNNKLNNLEWCTHKYNMNYGTIIERTSETRYKNKLIKYGYATKKPIKKRKYSYPKRNKIIQLTIDGLKIVDYDSISQAEKALNISHGNIHKCLKGQIKTCGGYKWEYAD